MAPPQYSDLGKTAKDLFNKGYNYGTVKLDVKTKTQNNIDFNITGEHNIDFQKSLATLEAKYKSASQGLTFVEKWNTDNILKSEITLEDKLTQGLKVGLDTSFSPASGKYFVYLENKEASEAKEALNISIAYKFSNNFNARLRFSYSAKGKKTGVLKTSYKHDKFLFNTDVDLDLSGPVVHSSVVVGHLGWLFGLQTTFDSAKSQLTRSNFAVGYQGNDFTLHTNVNDGTEVGGSIYQRINSDLDMGVSLSWSSVNNQARFALAAKQQLHKTASVQAKVNNLSQIGLAYSQQLRDGVKLVLSTLIDAKNINGGGHKLGLGLELNA
ncbi:voltage-dependent anion-selective channel 2 [Brachionus plicatilis]|uniref:Voltage-dependent anion-selective channel 2 n=1 Tax=Brachionus plicatilis TaxID=10195 RepID=A0A3M7PU75_BRAPC|nr:voltage-dependent anion-selective channel 2 [Brachionus plicatilis]